MPDFRPPDRSTPASGTKLSDVGEDQQQPDQGHTLAGDSPAGGPAAGEGEPSTGEGNTDANASEEANPPPREESAAAAGEQTPDHTSELKSGMAVRVRGLQSKPEMNGKLGRLLAFDDEKERWQVRLKDSVKLLKAENVVPVQSAPKPVSAPKTPAATKAEKANRKELPSHTLSADETVEWILAAADEFEAMLLPLQIEEDTARIRKQYKTLSLLVHPDKNNHPKAELAFKRLFGAMQSLCDPKEQRSAFQRARQRLGYNYTFGASDGKAWWEQATVDEMEKVFREMEKSMETAGFFGGSGLTEDQLWSSVTDARQLDEAGRAIFLDARDTRDFEVSHIKGALSLPGHTMEQLRNMTDTQAFRLVVKDPMMTVIVYSDNGSKLSRCVNVARALRAHLPPKPQRVLRLAGGLNEWKRHGFPVFGEARPLFAGGILGASVPRLAA